MQNMFTTQKEKQHYVPKFFLRRFSYQNDGKTIGVFNPKTGMFFPRGALKTQAYRPYFYGKDGVLEDRLSLVEGVTAELLRRITIADTPVKRGSVDHVGILFHLLLSSMRTGGNIDRMKSQLNDPLRKVFAEAPSGKLPKEMPQLTMTDEKAITFSMEFLEEGLEMCQDLEARVIKNPTPMAFITCDDPVLRYNQLLEKHRVIGGVTGTAHAGLQFFLPIDAQTLVVVYDSKYYKVGTRHTTGVVNCSEEDVNSINLLSMLNCEQTVFFNEQINHSYLKQLALRAARLPVPNQTVATKLYPIVKRGSAQIFSPEEPASYQSVVLHTYTTPLKTKLDLTFLRFTRESSRFIPYAQPANMRPHCAALSQRDNDQGPRTSVKFTYDD